MKDKKIKIQKKILRTFRVIRNIVVNGFKELFSDSKFDKIKKIIDENKFLIITSTIIVLFIAKNFYTIFNYNTEIKKANEEISKQTTINTQLKEDLEYYNTDEFILRYALEELNLRPTKELDLYHGEILQTKDVDESSDETINTDNESSETLESDNSNINEETENSLEDNSEAEGSDRGKEQDVEEDESSKYESNQP